MRIQGLAGAVVAVAIVAMAWTTTATGLGQPAVPTLATPQAGLGQPALPTLGGPAVRARPQDGAAQPVPATAGRAVFEQRCGQCHGGDGNGGEMGPAITTRLPMLSDADITTLIGQGRVAQGMPAQVIPPTEMTALLRHLRTIERREPPLPRRTVRLVDGATIEGEVLGEGFDDLQIRTRDSRIHLLRRQGDRVRRVTSEVDWPTYNGETGGNRHTTLRGIDKANVTRLAPRWMATVGEAGSLQVTPVVVDGIMYVTAPNECVALDAGSGRRLWRYKRPRTTGVSGGWANRGVAVAGDRVFMMTDHAHVIALDRFTGALLWDTTLADWRQNYAASSAPLPAGDLLVTGVAGGEHGANGFVAAVDQATGKEVWRFRTVPRPGEPGSETWQGKDIEHGGAPTWFTGSYDPALDLVYWPTGNPSKEYDGRDRLGDNLYASCILALERKTGRLRWHYQFTPHDLWDWDATQTSVVADVEWDGRARQVLLHADRNGFFYVFDRVTGERLLSTPFVTHLTWASGIGSDGRPIRLPNQEPSPEGTKVCPSQDGATNWFAPAFNPATGLYYVQTFEKCSIYTRSPQGPWESGKSYLGGSQRIAPDPVPQRILRAIDIRTGTIRWALPQPGDANSWGGTLTTATGLVFVGAEGGALLAVDAVTGEPLWSFGTNQSWKASPMTYQFDGTQYIAVAAGSNIIALAVQGSEDVPAAFPTADIANDRIQAIVYLPDASAGYYRGTRFDWSGAIASLRWNGHEYFGPWFERHDPLLHDGITGPVEEFQAGESSVGYAEAPVGGTFLRIGVGHVRKPDEPAYRRFATYEIVDPGAWAIERGPAAVTFVHTLGDSGGYAYVYRKTLRLEGDTLVLEHSLRNTGRKRIATSVYNHNFFTLDRRPTTPAVTVRFPFEAHATRELGPLAELAGRDLRFRRELAPGETVFTELEGFGGIVSDYDFRMEHRDTGAAVRIRGDRPLTRLVFWSAARTVCPEPYIDASVDPGQETTWRITYEFSGR